MITPFFHTLSRSSFVRKIQYNKDVWTPSTNTGNFFALLKPGYPIYQWDNVSQNEWKRLSDNYFRNHNLVPYKGVGSLMWEFGLLGKARQRFKRLWPESKIQTDELKDLFDEIKNAKTEQELKKMAKEYVKKTVSKKMKGGKSWRYWYIQFRKWKKRLRSPTSPATLLGLIKHKQGQEIASSFFNRTALKSIPLPPLLKIMFLML